MALLPFALFGNKRAQIDFNYPQTVSENAIKDLNSALKSGNGQMVVDALIRYSIAQSGISQEKMTDIVGRIDSTITIEKRPEYKSLLYYFEALVFKAYCDNYNRYDRHNPTDGKQPEDYTEWDREQFNAKIGSLLSKAMEHPEALKNVPVTELSGILTYNDEGVIYVPTLYEFMSMKCSKLADETSNDPIEKSISKAWVENTKGNVPAHIFARLKSSSFHQTDIYNEFKDNEYSGLALADAGAYKDNYPYFQEYVKKFPKSRYTPAISNHIYQIERKSVEVNYSDYATSRENIKVNVDINNVNDFTLNVYRIPDKLVSRDRYGKDIALSDLKLVSSERHHIDGTIPFNKRDYNVSLPALPYGQYFIVPSYSAEGATVTPEKMNRYRTLTVTDIMLFNLSKDNELTSNKTGNNRIFAVDATTGAPLQGVTIEGPKFKGVTDKDGCVNLPDMYSENRANFMASKGNDHYGPNLYFRQHSGSNNSVNHTAQVFTDLAIYRPGETVKFVVLAYETAINMRRTSPNMDLTIILQDPNSKNIDTLTLKTDAYGRAEGSFVIPTDHMNGKFSIIVQKGLSRSYSIAYHSIDVSEYKTPTFDVTFPDAKFSYTKGAPVKITGLVETYSGMPVANAPVKLQLYQKEWSWWWKYSSRDKGELLRDSVVTTDAQGRFSIEFPATLFEENTSKYYRWAHYNYTLNAACTDAAGETQESSHKFIVGQRRGLQFSNDNITHVNTSSVTLPLQYNTTDESKPNITCNWVLKAKGSEQVAASGTLDTAKPVLDLTKVPSGQYELTVSIPDGEGNDESSAKATLTLYRLTDKEAPVKDTSLWVPEAGRRVDNNNVAHITIGTSTPESHIYYVAQSRNKIIAEGWLHYKPGMHQLDIPIPQGNEEFIYVEMVSAHDRITKKEMFKMIAPASAQKLKVKVTTFRDKLVPGEHEHWTMQLVDKDGKPRPGAMILEMIDKAINSLSDNTWNFSVPLSSSTLYSINNQSLSGNTTMSVDWIKESLKEHIYKLPELYLYDQDLFGFMSYNETRMYKSMGGAPMRAAMRPVAEESADMLVANESAVMMDAGEVPEKEVAAQLDNVKLREADIKTALWMPMLTSDKDGNVQIEFDAPEFNTTWIMQAIGFDKDLYSDQVSREVLTQKPIMVKSSVPRFLRHGDVVTLAANVQNATENATRGTAVIELFNPRTSDIYSTQTIPVQLDGMGTQAVKINWTVPSDIPFVGFRIKAANESFGDGEQVMIPVLEATSPVIETKPFYIEAGAQRFISDIPNVAQDARVTLEYCDNPVWYCVTALPTIFDENYEISTRLAHNLFAIDIAQGVANAQPQIREAVAYWKEHSEDSTLVSMLAKNQDLKVGTLLASPWVREADRQTLRMSRLNELFDAQLMSQERSKIIDALMKLQMSDGGWTWFRYPNCKSSTWVTQEVLELIGETRHLGFLPQNGKFDQCITRAVHYLDNEYLRMYKEMKNKKELGWFTSYAYVRTLYQDVPMQREIKSVFDKVLKYMDKNWGKGLSLGEKAFFAMTLNRNGYQKTAKDIMESVRQFALVKPELGMYWDNLQVGWRYFDKVAVTATILQALNECDPRRQEIDNVRKWMLLMKQSNDWGSSSLAADAVYSLLATGSQWLERNPMPTVTVGGEKVIFDKIDEYLGYCRKTIPTRSGASVVIEREGNSPAWGAVYTQYTAPMTEIAEVSITELSISKEFYRYNNDGTLVPVSSFNVGDKVQVRLVIKNNKDMDFVTIKDERAACFEPVDQTSHYEHADYSWYYHETKDAITNLFFTDLQKGTHVINYDVFVTASGQFSAGIATAQCQYAPQLTAHSAGRTITVE